MCFCVDDCKKNTVHCNTVMMPGLQITQWGPSGWNILHAMAHTLPSELDEEERTRLNRFLFDFAHFLPCRLCSRHFTKFLSTRSTECVLSSRKNVIRMLFDAHNEVNVRTGKPKLTLDDYTRLYSLDGKRQTWLEIQNVLLSTLIGVCLFFVCKRRTLSKKKLASN